MRKEQRTINNVVVFLILFSVFLFSCPIDGSLEALRPKVKVKAISYTVSFEANGGLPEPEAQSVMKGKKAQEPAAMTKTGYAFDGWYTDGGFANRWNFAEHTISADTTLFAKWDVFQPPDRYTITFVANGGTPVPDSPITVNHGGILTVPVAMSRTGYAFSGWYRDDAFINEWDFENDIVTSNLTLYALWTFIPPNSFLVTFDSMGGSLIHDEIVVNSGKIIQPENPVRNAYAFIGWFKEAACVNEWNFSVEIVTGNIILYAKWFQISGFLVRFIADGGSPVPYDQAVSRGGKVIEPAISKANATFGGWYHDAARTIPWFFDDDTVNAPVILYAKWNEVGKFSVNFSANEGTPIWSNISVEYGSTITSPANIIKTGYIVEWYLDVALTTLWNFNTEIIVENTTLFAKWIAIPIISAQPQSSDHDIGSAITLSVGANAADGRNLSYQWYRNTSAGNKGGTPITGALSQSYNPPSNEPGTFYYYVVVTNSIEAASVTSNAATIRVLINKAIIITVEGMMSEWELMNQLRTVSANTPADFTVDGPYSSYKWYLDGVLAGSAATYYFNQQPGVYELVVVVSVSNGEERSGRCFVTAIRNEQ